MSKHLLPLPSPRVQIIVNDPAFAKSVPQRAEEYDESVAKLCSTEADRRRRYDNGHGRMDAIRDVHSDEESPATGTPQASAEVVSAVSAIEVADAAATLLYTCDGHTYGCGYSGIYDDVAAHEQDCGYLRTATAPSSARSEMTAKHKAKHTQGTPSYAVTRPQAETETAL
jgi:hypothetical protein